MSRRRLVVAAVVGLLVTLSALALANGNEADAPSDYASARLEAQRPLLIVTQQVDSEDAYPVEGAISQLRLRGPGAIRYDAKFSHQDFAVSYPVRLGGTFTLTSFQRVCGGSCADRALDPPSDRCMRRFTVGERQLVRAVIRLRFGGGCTISVAPAKS